MTSPVPFRLRFGRGVYKWSLIAGLVLFAGMIASLIWHVLWPLWTEPGASPDKWAMAARLSIIVAVDGAVAAAGIALIGWIVRFALTRERSLWPGRHRRED